MRKNGCLFTQIRLSTNVEFAWELLPRLLDAHANPGDATLVAIASQSMPEHLHTLNYPLVSVTFVYTAEGEANRGPFRCSVKNGIISFNNENDAPDNAVNANQQHHNVTAAIPITSQSATT